MEVLLAQPRGFCAGVDRAIEIVERALQQSMLQLGMLAGKAVKGAAGEEAQARVGERRDAVRRAAAEGATDEVGRIDHADNLLAPVAGRGRQFERAVDHIGDDGGVVAFPHHRLSRRDRDAPAQAIERAALILFQRSADGAVAHLAALAEAGVGAGGRNGHAAGQGLREIKMHVHDRCLARRRGGHYP